jgi:hypothetical protein
MSLTPEQLFLFAGSGVAISLLLEYFPKLSVWYNALPDNQQRLLVLGSGLLVVLGAFGLTCLELLVLPWVCTAPGLYDALLAFVAFIIANQSAYLVSPKPDRG